MNKRVNPYTTALFVGVGLGSVCILVGVAGWLWVAATTNATQAFPFNALFATLIGIGVLFAFIGFVAFDVGARV